MAERSLDFLTAVGIGVSDLDRSIAFYRDVLGMQQTQLFKLAYMDEVVMSHQGRSAVLLMHYTDGRATNYGNLPMKLVFYVTDVHAVAGKVRASGQAITHEPAPNASNGGTVICMAEDPDGYVIELMQRPARATQTAEAVG
jgi:predicted enzyme related to lactoylglutathione lyase